MHSLIFEGVYAGERPFRNRAWEAWLLPCPVTFTYLEDDNFDAIELATSGCGDSEIVAWNAEVITPEPAAIISWRREELDALRDTWLPHFETHVFGKSATWGLVGCVGDFACLGGDLRFMGVMAERVASREIVRERFIRYAHESLIPGWSPTPDPKSVLKELLQTVGWQ
jgi:hypothetical protein